MKLLSAFLGLVLAFDSNEAPTPLAVEVEVESLPADREQSAERLSEALTTDLLGRGLEIEPSSNVRLVVQLRPGPGPDQDVVIRTELRDGEQVLFGGEPEICMACSDAQLLEMVVQVLPNVIDALPREEPIEAAVEVEPSAEDEPLPAHDDQAGDRLGPNPALLYSGAAVVIVGSIGLGVGAGLLVVGERTVSDPGAAVRERVNYRPAGIALVSTGAAVAVAGAVMLGLALSKRRQSEGRVAFAPWAGSEGAGAVVAGRF